METSVIFDSAPRDLPLVVRAVQAVLILAGYLFPFFKFLLDGSFSCTFAGSFESHRVSVCHQFFASGIIGNSAGARGSNDVQYSVSMGGVSVKVVFSCNYKMCQYEFWLGNPFSWISFGGGG